MCTFQINGNRYRNNIMSIIIYLSSDRRENQASWPRHTWKNADKSEEKSMDGSYTRLLRKVLNVNALDKIVNEDLYGKLPRGGSRWISWVGLNFSMGVGALWAPSGSRAKPGWGPGGEAPGSSADFMPWNSPDCFDFKALCKSRVMKNLLWSRKINQSTTYILSNMNVLEI